MHHPLPMPNSTRRLIAAAVVAAPLAAAPALAAPSPRLVKDINPTGMAFIENFVTLDGRAYFRADDGTHGTELWTTDGTTAGTQMVLDLNPGAVNGFPGNLTAANGQLYFYGFNTSDFLGSKVFTSDGTADGTRLLVDTYPGGNFGGFFGPPPPSNFTALNNNVVLFTAVDPEGGQELWRTDNTTAGTYRIKDIHPGEQWSVPTGLTVLDGVAYFAADDQFTPTGTNTGYYDRELFRTDGTAAGTYRVADIMPGAYGSTPVGFTRFGDAIYFRAVDDMHGGELWKTDGTAAGTQLVADINPTGGSGIQDLTVVGDTMYFFGDNGASGPELFATDGTAAGTRLVKDINPTGGAFPFEITGFDDRVFFSADDGTHGSELWVSDGTSEGTELFLDLNAGSLRSGPDSLTVVGDQLFFVTIVPDDANFTVRSQLWMTDGTVDGTEMVFEEPGDSFGYSITNLTVLGDTLLFTAPTDVDADGISTNVELMAITVPEPTTGVAVAVAGFGLLARRRRRA